MSVQNLEAQWMQSRMKAAGEAVQPADRCEVACNAAEGGSTKCHLSVSLVSPARVLSIAQEAGT